MKHSNVAALAALFITALPLRVMSDLGTTLEAQKKVVAQEQEKILLLDLLPTQVGDGFVFPRDPLDIVIESVMIVNTTSHAYLDVSVFVPGVFARVNVNIKEARAFVSDEAPEWAEVEARRGFPNNGLVRIIEPYGNPGGVRAILYIDKPTDTTYALRLVITDAPGEN